MNILGYAQHGGTTIMGWKLIHIPNLGPKVLNPWITMQMLGENFNDLISPTSHEGFNAFIWFNGHVHDSVKVIQYRTSHAIIFDFFHQM
jgi:hypothetical protein